MFRDVIDEYRKKAKEQLEDAAQLGSGRWCIGNQDGDQSSALADFKRGLAAKLNALANAYERRDR